MDIEGWQFILIATSQGRHRVFKSGPAEEAIECLRHKRGRAREGDFEMGVWGASPKNFFEF